MVAAAVVIGVIALWLTTKRLEFGWRMGWILAGFGLVCASSLAAGGHLAAGIAGGIFEGAKGLAAFFGDL
jgi:hypothetical protein